MQRKKKRKKSEKKREDEITFGQKREGAEWGKREESKEGRSGPESLWVVPSPK